MKRIAIVASLLLSACGAPQEPTVRVEYLPAAVPQNSEPAPSETPSAAIVTPVPSALPDVVPSPVPSEIPTVIPSATPVADPTPVPSDMPEPVVSPTPAPAVSVTPSPSPTPSPSATPCMQVTEVGDVDGSEINHYDCGTWIIADEIINAPNCNSNHPGLWSLANSPDRGTINADGSLSIDYVTFPATSSFAKYQMWVFANGSYGTQVQIACGYTIHPAPGD